MISHKKFVFSFFVCVFSLEQNPQISSPFKAFHRGHTHNYSAKSGSKISLDKPYSQIYTYGTKSVMNNCIKDWDSFKRSFHNIFQGKSLILE